MTVILITMIAVLVVAGVVAGLVLVGMEGRGGDRAPKLTQQMTRAAKHLNGEAKPPKKFVRMVESSLTR
ncbi:hypothetical protein [Microlunatus ginsengisoli]|uniref:Uncharacterized protein n=1 Tax=Microlunatus ginsengisoli TaxID=363863 RepID=A0ABP7A6H4_9ACTN